MEIARDGLAYLDHNRDGVGNVKGESESESDCHLFEVCVLHQKFQNHDYTCVVASWIGSDGRPLGFGLDGRRNPVGGRETLVRLFGEEMRIVDGREHQVGVEADASEVTGSESENVKAKNDVDSRLSDTSSHLVPEGENETVDACHCPTRRCHLDDDGDDAYAYVSSPSSNLYLLYRLSLSSLSA